MELSDIWAGAVMLLVAALGYLIGYNTGRRVKEEMKNGDR